jgi:hypothetical protein
LTSSVTVSRKAAYCTRALIGALSGVWRTNEASTSFDYRLYKFFVKRS